MRVPLQILGPSRKDDQAVALRVRDEFLHETGLADAGLSMDEDGMGRSATHLERSGDSLPLFSSAEQSAPAAGIPSSRLMSRRHACQCYP
jgi:hypothetical protein